MGWLTLFVFIAGMNFAHAAEAPKLKTIDLHGQTVDHAAPAPSDKLSLPGLAGSDGMTAEQAAAIQAELKKLKEQIQKQQAEQQKLIDEVEKQEDETYRK